MNKASHTWTAVNCSYNALRMVFQLITQPSKSQTSEPVNHGRLILVIAGFYQVQILSKSRAERGCFYYIWTPSFYLDFRILDMTQCQPERGATLRLLPLESAQSASKPFRGSDRSYQSIIPDILVLKNSWYDALARSISTSKNRAFFCEIRAFVEACLNAHKMP